MTHEIKHTQGPWIVCKEAAKYNQWFVMTEKPVGGARGSMTVCTAGGEANARLIAAAPDLLAAGRELQALYMDLLDGMKPDAAHPVSKMQAAIAKALGE